jgi:hypothetical protein
MFKYNPLHLPHLPYLGMKISHIPLANTRTGTTAREPCGVLPILSHSPPYLELHYSGKVAYIDGISFGNVNLQVTERLRNLFYGAGPEDGSARSYMKMQGPI